MNLIDQLHQKMKSRMRIIVRKGSRLDLITNTLLPADPDEIDNPAHLAKTTILAGLWLAALVFGVFGVWSVLAKIDSAAIAPGKVIVEQNRKTINHLEGGIVEEILVEEGETVKAGQVLLRLREISAKARMQLLTNQYHTFLAAETRLLAERGKSEELTFPKVLHEVIDTREARTATVNALKQEKAQAGKSWTPAQQEKLDEALRMLEIADNVASIMDNQQRIFKSRTENVRGQLDILDKRISKSGQEIKGLEIQANSMDDQIKLLTEEIGVVDKLVKDGNATRPRLLSLQRNRAELEGRKGEYLAMKAKAQENIDETSLAKLNTESDYMNKVEEELKEAQMQLSDLRERMAASSDILERVEIRAPVDGFVTALSVHTRGGTVKPGEKILDIIPLNDKMIVEARVSPQDIDVVKQGLPARVRLTAYKTRQVPPIDGVVKTISADEFTDERTGHGYYNARIEINASELADLKDIELYPGMPADALIITGSRTFLAYMLDPISQSFNKSFRQQ